MDTDTILNALKGVMDPELNRSIVDLGMVHDLEFENGVVTFSFALTTMACPLRGHMQDDIRQTLMALDGVSEVVINTREMTPQEKQAIMGQPSEQEGSAAHLNHFGQIIAVLSGKGGVGKSTVSALLAVSLQRKGYKVGVLDADITGPSIPKMMLPESARPMGGPHGIIPVRTESGIKVMSINLLLEDPNQAVIWRGPLISGAIKQFYGDVVWGDLDYLIVDLPPGTSDASLTVMQSLPVNGIVLVTTPQSLAGMVVRKASSMAEQLQIPIVGLIENMAYVTCPDCGKQIALFGESNAAEIAVSMGVPVLGKMPINPEISRLADAGKITEYDTSEFDEMVESLSEC